MRRHTIIKQIQQKDEKAIEQLIHELYPQIYAYVYVRMHGRDCSKDITQDVFLRFITHIDTFEFRGKTRHYLLRIAANCCNTWYQKDKTYELEESMDQCVAPKPTSNHLLYYLHKLPAEQKEVLVLKYYEGLKSREIAHMLQISENTVKTRVRLGICKLRDMMKEDEG